MGQSTDGILCYGIQLPDCLDGSVLPPWGEDFDDWVAKRAGLVSPPANYQGPDWLTYWDAKNTAVAACPAVEVRHCSGDYPMWILAIRGTVKTASRGSPETIRFGALESFKDENLEGWRTICCELGLGDNGEWLLCSDWS